MSKKNILTLYDSRRASGQVSRLKRLIWEYSSQGYQVHYIASEELFKTEVENVEAHIIKVPFKKRKGFLYWAYLSSMMLIYFYILCLRYLPRKVIFFETYYSLLCYLPATLIRAKKILLMRAVAFRRDSGFEISPLVRLYSRSIDYLGLLSANLIIAPTDWMRAQLLTRVPFLNRRVHVLPYATRLPKPVEKGLEGELKDNSTWIEWLDDHAERKKKLCRNYQISEKSLIVALSGKRANKDDVVYFLRTMFALESSKLVLIIFGQQDDKLSLLTLVGGLGLSEQVIFIDSALHGDSIIAGSDLFLHSSGEEGMSTDLLGALGSGLGVIAMETDEMKEILVHKDCLLPKDNVGECAIKMADFVNNRERLEACRRLSRERAQAYNFDWPLKVLELVQ